MANKFKKCAQLSSNQKMRIKTTLSYYYRPAVWLKFETNNVKCWQGCHVTEPAYNTPVGV